jgi:CheY-like chemotaxis protein
MSFALVVDDNRTTADTLVQILRTLGISARAAYGSQPAMTILTSQSPAMAFLDVNMPGVSGLELLKFISRDPRLSKMPVFVVTSDDQWETRNEALQYGARDVLIKPATVESVEQALKDAKIM